MEIPEWWGHSPEHGWVVTHRDLRFADISQIPLYRCQDATVVHVPNKQCKSIVHGPSYYQQLSEPHRTGEMQGFAALRAAWLDHCDVLEDAITSAENQAIQAQKAK